jgi:hypothetical protein
MLPLDYTCCPESRKGWNKKILMKLERWRAREDKSSISGLNWRGVEWKG